MSIFFQSADLSRFEVSMHNPSRKLHKAMPTGALPYFDVLTDTHSRMSYDIIICMEKKYVN